LILRHPQYELRRTVNAVTAWGAVSAWQEANFSIDFHIKRHYHRLKVAIQIACRKKLEDEFIRVIT
jgi:hypothetical protein